VAGTAQPSRPLTPEHKPAPKQPNQQQLEEDRKEVKDLDLFQGLVGGAGPLQGP
jgi:hypothetical protein